MDTAYWAQLKCASQRCPAEQRTIWGRREGHAGTSALARLLASTARSGMSLFRGLATREGRTGLTSTPSGALVATFRAFFPPTTTTTTANCEKRITEHHIDSGIVRRDK